MCVRSLSRKSRDLDALRSREVMVVMKVGFMVTWRGSEGVSVSVSESEGEKERERERERESESDSECECE